MRLDVDPREHRASTGLAAVGRKHERVLCPLVDEVPVQADREHRRADRRLESEKGEGVRALHVVQRAVERVEERGAHALTVVPERVGLAELPPESSAIVRIVGQLERSREELDRFVELVAPACELARSPQPVHGTTANALELVEIVGPHEVRVLGPGGLCVVVGEKRSVLVAAVRLAQPIGERGVQTASTCLGDTRVRDLTRERVLDRVLRRACHRRSGPTVDEVSLLEEIEVGLLAVEEMDDRARPEVPTEN